MKSIEEPFERILFASRWLAAPIYLGLVAALVMLLIVFARELWTKFPLVWQPSYSLHEVLMEVLTLIDIALVANLVVIVVLAGYENFVSRIDVKPADERLAWMGTIDFSGLKLKLFASMVAITGIELLKAFIRLLQPIYEAPTQIGHFGPESLSADVGLQWLVIIHATFLFTTVFAALTDWLASRSKANLESSARSKSPGDDCR